MTDEEKVKKPTRQKKAKPQNEGSQFENGDSDLAISSETTLVDNTASLSNQNAKSENVVDSSADNLGEVQENKQEVTLKPNQLKVTNSISRKGFCITSCLEIPPLSTVVIEYKDVLQKHIAVRNFEQINALQGRAQYAWET